MTIGESLKIIRKNRGMTQKELSLATGICQQHISKIERNEINPNVETFLKIIGALGLKINYEPNQK